MPIRPVTDGLAIEPGGIYLIPRKSNLAMFGGKLYLKDQEQGLNLPIDRFMESLADYRGDHAVGIVLSGTGSDGTRGVRAIKQRVGVDLSYYKESTVLRRLERRMGVNQITDLESYVQFPEEFPQEVSTLFKEILIGVIRFFRDDHVFGAIEVDIVPALFYGKAPDDEIRVWVSGCSTGEEAYSLAMLLAEFRRRMGMVNEIKVFATDIDRDELEFASYGTYPESIVADVSPERLQQWFVRLEDRYRVVPQIREKAIFAYHNLLQDPPFRSMDLVSCRNLLIYLQPVLQRRVLSNFPLQPRAWRLPGVGEQRNSGPGQSAVPLNQREVEALPGQPGFGLRRLQRACAV